MAPRHGTTQRGALNFIEQERMLAALRLLCIVHGSAQKVDTLLAARPGTVSKWMSGEQRPGRPMAERIVLMSKEAR